MNKFSLYCILSILCFNLLAQKNPSSTQTQNVILITLDGMRWQEVFNGADNTLLINKSLVDDTVATKLKFWAETIEERRKKLMPFFWSTLAVKGQLYGNQMLGNQVNVSNNQWFSYPGYSEILTGYADNERIHSNDKFNNPNKNVLEFIQSKKGFEKKVAAFSSWEVFPFIINSDRNKIPVNSGVVKAQGNLSDREKLLNDISFQVPNDEGETRLDGLTFQYAFEYLKLNHPRVLFISFDETDHFAHEGRYDRYLKSAHYTDDMIRTMWEWIQSQPGYKDKTTLLITTDHGRGAAEDNTWKDHGQKVKNANQIWLAVIGPDTPAKGEVKTAGLLYQNQVAKTLAAFLGLDFVNDQKNEGVVIQSAGNFK